MAANLTFKAGLLVDSDNTYQLGSATATWKIERVNAPTASGGTTFGPGTNGQVLKSNGSTIYWASDANTTPYGIRVYRQTSGYNDDYPLLVSRSLASAITATNGGYLNNVYGVIYNTNIPTLNPSTGKMKVPGGVSVGTITITTATYGETLPATGEEGQLFFQLSSANSSNPILDMIYPIGSIYMSVNSINPSNLFGGTWEQIQDRFLLCAGSNYAGGSTGGSATMSHTHTQVATTSGGPSNNTSGSTSLSVAQMPSHNHGSAGAHTHAANDIWFVYDAGSWADRYGPSITTQHTPLVDDNPGTITKSAGAHTHSSNGSGSGHTHTLSSHTHTTSATTTGGASDNNNMPPYLAVYVWKRIS